MEANAAIAAPAAPDAGGDPSADAAGHLRACLAVLRRRVIGAVEAKRERAGADDPLRGLYVSDADLQVLIGEGTEPSAEPVDLRASAPSPGGPALDGFTTGDPAEADLPLHRMARAFALEPLDLDLLLLALLPEVDPGVETMLAFLQDDVDRRRPSAGLALALCGADPLDHAARARLLDGAPLLDTGLVTLARRGEPFGSRELRLPDRVVLQLLGSEDVDPILAAALHEPGPALSGDIDGLARCLQGGAQLVYLHEQPAASGAALADATFAQLHVAAICLDLTPLPADTDLEVLASTALRDARLLGRGLVVGPVERLVGARDGPVGLIPTASPALRLLADASWPVVLVGRRSWDPAWSRTVPVTLDVPTPPAAVVSQAWHALTEGLLADDVDPAEETAAFRLDVEQLQRAVVDACHRADQRGGPVTREDLRAGARAQNAAGLQRLTSRVEPQARWDDLVLPAGVTRLLRELVDRAQLRGRILDEWGLHRGGRRGEGITALFGGPPGTGKTLAAEVLAAELGLDLYTVDLASVVDKYIGETEKNLDRIFTEATRVNGVLLFDEADALFGKRSDVADAHDRYANIETAYLLQRMETFDGVAILATNLMANLDDAFSRRLDSLIEFPFPDAEQRLQLWDHCFSGRFPVDGVDLEFCAEAFPLSGGNIRNIVVAAAFFTAADPDAKGIGMPQVIRAVEREYAKLGRMCIAEEFGPYHHLVATP